MKKYIIQASTLLVIVFIISIIGLTTGVAQAQELESAKGIPTSIVSCSGVEASDGLPACNWCSFVKLISNLIQYSIFLAVILSSLMFAYAGFLFLTNNGNPQKVTAAWAIFRRTIYGIIAILAAWLIVNAIMTKVAGDGIGEDWSKLTDCRDVEDPVRTSSDIYDGVGVGDYGGYDAGEYIGSIPTEEYNEYLEKLRDERVMQSNIRERLASDVQAETGSAPKINKDLVNSLSVSRKNGAPSSSPCRDNDVKCVYIAGLNKSTVAVIEDLKDVCDCEIIITRAAEDGYEDEDPNGTYTYLNGYKVSIAARPSETNFLTSTLRRVGRVSDGPNIYEDKCGNAWEYRYQPSDLESSIYKSEWVATIKYAVPASAGDSCF